MFTGIIEEIGTIISTSKNGITIKATKILTDIHLGDSIAVNGTCLTVTDFNNSSFTVDIMDESYKCTNLHELKTDDKVNLERAMQINSRFGGHIVSGHVDGVGKITNIEKQGISKIYTITPPKDIMKYMIYKGSITIDGISLTISYIDNTVFQVSIIPHTQCETILSLKKIGDSVNLETDIIAAYVEKLMGYKNEKKESNITLDFLNKCGF